MNNQKNLPPTIIEDATDDKTYQAIAISLGVDELFVNSKGETFTELNRAILSEAGDKDKVRKLVYNEILKTDVVDTTDEQRLANKMILDDKAAQEEKERLEREAVGGDAITKIAQAVKDSVPAGDAANVADTGKAIQDKSTDIKDLASVANSMNLADPNQDKKTDLKNSELNIDTKLENAVDVEKMNTGAIDGKVALDKVKKDVDNLAGKV